MGWVEGAPPPSAPKTGGGCCRGMSRVWLVIFNIFFMLLGLGILTIGILLRFNTELFETYVMDIMTSAEVDGVNLKEIFQSVAIVFMMLGFIVIIFATMGIIGACCQVKMLLTIYALLMLKIIILEVVALVLLLVFQDEIEKKIKSALQATLNTYQGYNSTEPVSIGWNYVFSKFDCCGIDSYLDFANVTTWLKNTNYLGSSVSLTAPIFCCVMDGTYPYMTLPATATCGVSPNSTTSNYLKGCYDAVEDYIMAYRTALMVICGVILLVEVANIITAITVRQGKAGDEKKKKKHKRQMRAWQRTKRNQVGT